MALNEQDREWVRAIVQEALSQTIGEVRASMDAAIDRHQRTCTFLLQSRAAILGVAIGAAFGGSGLTVLIQRLL